MVKTHPAPLLSSLSAAERKEISQCGQVLQFKRGEPLFEDGSPADWAWLVQKGWVRLVKTGPRGHHLTVALVTPEESFCGISALERGTYASGALAVTSVEALRIPSACFHKLMVENPSFDRRLLSLLSLRIHRMASRFVSVAYRSVPQRIAEALLELSGPSGREIPLTARELADLAGTTIETALRVLGHFKKEGIIEHRRGIIVVFRPEGLQEMLHEA